METHRLFLDLQEPERNGRSFDRERSPEGRALYHLEIRLVDQPICPLRTPFDPGSIAVRLPRPVLDSFPPSCAERGWP
jgi:hypothetical protein